MVAYPVVKNSKTKRLYTSLIVLSWVFPCAWNIGFITATTRVVDGQCLFQGVWPSLPLGQGGSIVISHLRASAVFVMERFHETFDFREHWIHTCLPL